MSRVALESPLKSENPMLIGERHNSWWIGCSLPSLSRNQNEPLDELWRNENRTVVVTHFHQAVQIEVLIK
jgi:hypothetical protein